MGEMIRGSVMFPGTDRILVSRTVVIKYRRKSLLLVTYYVIYRILFQRQVAYFFT